MYLHSYICRFLKKLCQISDLNQKMKIFRIRSTHVKPTFFETLGILKCKKKSVHKIFLESIFCTSTAIDFILINFYRLFSLYIKTISATTIVVVTPEKNVSPEKCVSPEKSVSPDKSLFARKSVSPKKSVHLEKCVSPEKSVSPENQ